MWLFKPVKAGEEFRAHAEAAVSRIGSVVRDGDAVMVQTVSLTGRSGQRFGSIQRFHENTKRQESFAGTRVSQMSKQDVEQVQEEHVLDWLISNHDSHPENWVRLSDGRVLGIDKGQAFRFFGADRLRTDYHPNGAVGEAPPLYNPLYEAMRRGEITRNTDAVWRAVRRVETIPDSEFRAWLEPYARSLFANPSDRGLFLDLAVARKQNIRRDFEGFLATIEPREELVKRLKDPLSIHLLGNRGREDWERSDFKDVLTFEEFAFIRSYTGGSYSDVNRLLRQVGIRFEPVEVGRAFGAIASDGLRKMKVHKGTVYRGLEFVPEDLGKQLRALEPGDVYADPGFQSTSKSAEKAFSGEIRFIIKSRTGRDVQSISLHEREQEVLFPPGAQFLVTKVEEKPRAGRRDIYMVDINEMTPREVAEARKDALGD